MHSRSGSILRLHCSICLLLIAIAGFAQVEDSVAAPVSDTAIVYDSVVETREAGAHSFNSVESFEQERTAVRALPDSFTNGLRKDGDFDYVKNGLRPPSGAAATSAGSKSGFFRILAGFLTVLPYIAIGLFVVLLVWYLAANNFILFRTKSKSIAAPTVLEERQDIFSIDYTVSIRQALQQKNYRLAIRLQYLELLKILSDKDLIHFVPDKTNIEYLLQMRATRYYDDFFAATRNYEYSWYGLFEISENMYQKINSTFQQLKQKL
ncbi:hypothetical protein [Niabella drilacis]|uniref:DUF4129 domain-containing protein n=1 Tax=Niabella drilacis (strain DSM 25811 / CCM 8410 / CCUG 62505 / LMG 26954 / E90) TaxID=1285928 RepID=A0A1G6VTN2_NIADE|nr:hypothetical protein [Niabella drilacis]SDD56918.1 hypothetical protein SAMN04487894_110147 [Niabella drilacis]